jgi:hypothetical protein
MFCLIIIISVREGRGPQPLVYINYLLTTHVKVTFFPCYLSLSSLPSYDVSATGLS